MVRLFSILIGLTCCCAAPAQRISSTGPSGQAYPLRVPGVGSSRLAGQLVYDGNDNSIKRAVHRSFSQTPVNAAVYGFTTTDHSGNANADAFVNMVSAMRVQGGYTAVSFQPGTYVINAESLKYHKSLCSFVNMRNIIIDGSQATFKVINDNAPKSYVMAFDGCTNVTLRFNWVGTNYTISKYGVGGVWFRGWNSNVDYSFTSNRMFEGVRIGEGEDPRETHSDDYEGNHDFNINAKCIDTHYACPVYLASNINIWSESIGTAAGGWGSWRNVYLQGCSNVHAVSRVKNLSVSDGCNCIAIGPRFTSPQMVGCSNIWLDATDLGTTRFIKYQMLVKMYQVAAQDSNLTNLSATHNNININVDLTVSHSLWGANPVVVFDCGGTGANEFKDITISGRVNRTEPTGIPLIDTVSSMTGLAALDLTLFNFHTTMPSQPTMRVSLAEPVVKVNSYLCDLGTFRFAAPGRQTHTLH